MPYLDARELMKELDELRDQKDDAEGDEDVLGLDEGEEERLTALLELEEALGPGSDVTLIPDDEFEDYAEEMAYDVGFVERNSTISSYIDWERWADDCKSDYTTITFDGDDYLYRE